MIIRQAELCRQLVTDTAEHRVRLQEQCVDARTPITLACIELPVHASLMGISAMPPISLEVFGRLAEYIDSDLQNRGIAECPRSFFAQTTVRFMCISVMVACLRLRFVLPALVVLGLEAHGFTTAWISVVANVLERGLAKSLDPAWSLCLRASVHVWSQS
jgi:exodeoxyribonuclease V gamma subunit